MAKTHGKCIFMFGSRPAFNGLGLPDGESISVYSTGEVIKYQYVCGDEQPASEEILAKSPDLAKKVAEIIKRNSELLNTIPGHLNNGTLDGSADYFRFGKKMIQAWTIRRTDISKLRKKHMGLSDECLKECEHENIVLDVYNEIAEEVNRHVKSAKMYIY